MWRGTWALSASVVEYQGPANQHVRLPSAGDHSRLVRDEQIRLRVSSRICSISVIVDLQTSPPFIELARTVDKFVDYVGLLDTKLDCRLKLEATVVHCDSESRCTQSFACRHVRLDSANAGTCCTSVEHTGGKVRLQRGEGVWCTANQLAHIASASTIDIIQPMANRPRMRLRSALLWSWKRSINAPSLFQ